MSFETEGLQSSVSLESRNQGHLLRLRQAWNKELMKVIRVWKKHYETCKRKVTRESTSKFSAVLGH